VSFFKKNILSFISYFFNSEFSQVEAGSEQTTSICFIEAKNRNQFIGRGANKKMAKYNACRKAIKLKLGVINMEIN
jgi:hypothetical protein